MALLHEPVLLEQVLHAFDAVQLPIFLDATLGAGGHAAALLAAHPEIQLLIGIDQDPTAREIAEERLAPWKAQLKIVDGNFAKLSSLLSEMGIQKVDGMLFDLGVSSMQLDQPEKGFSFLREGPLDMRMDPSNPLTAEEIVNGWSEAQLGAIFREYGEEKRWRRAAQAIVRARQRSPLKSTSELAGVLQAALPGYHKKGIHPATLIFQALRICVNDELNAIKQALPAAIAHLNPGSRLAVISFHSLEDRIVKQALRYAASDKEDTSGVGGIFLDKAPQVKLVTRKPIQPNPEQIARNPRCRSAKLRVAEKCACF